MASVPSSISAAAQEYLEHRTHPARVMDIDAGDTSAWLRQIEKVTDGMRTQFAGFDELPVEVSERRVDGVRVFVLRAAEAPGDAVLFDIHGGGFVMGGGEVCRLIGMAAAHRTGLETWAVDYRRPPLHSYPAGLDDILSVYRQLLRDRPSARVVVAGGCAGGGSAGSNLAAALTLRTRDEGLPMPVALILFSPYVDLGQSGDTIATNEGLDCTLTAAFLRQRGELYSGGTPVSEPYVSPLAGELHDFPPTMIVSGTRDLMLSDSVRMHRKLRSAGVDAELHVWEAMSHGGLGGPGFSGDSPEDSEIEAEVRRFIAKALPSA